MCDRKSRLRFAYEDDVVLLREFLNTNPIVNPQGWIQMQEHILISTKKNFQIRTLKTHTMLLLDTYLNKIKDEQIRSGVEEPICERDQLLQEISSLCKESNYTFKDPRKKTALSKEQQLCKLGKEVRANCAKSYYEEIKLEDEVATNLPEKLQNNSAAFHIEDHNYIAHEDVQSDILELEQIYVLPDNEIPLATANVATPVKTPRSVQMPTKRRLKPREPVRKNALAYLTDKSNREAALREKEMELEERKIIIEEKKLKLEERKMQLEEKRFEADSKEKSETLRICQHLLESQQEIIKKLLEKEFI